MAESGFKEVPPEQQKPTMSDTEREELEQYRAERNRREALVKATMTDDGKPNLDLDPVKDKEAFAALSEENQIRAHYLHGRGTIQDYARMWKLTVEQVLHILGHDDMTSKETTGDLVDAGDVGPENAAMIRRTGTPAHANYSTN